MGIHDIFEVNTDKELDGFHLVVLDGDTEVSFLLARAGGANKRFSTRLQALMRPYKHAVDTGTMKEDKAAEILSQAIADTVILDWENVVGKEGEEIPFSPAAAKILLTELPELRALIFEEAQNAANFLAAEREEDSGN